LKKKPGKIRKKQINEKNKNLTNGENKYKNPFINICSLWKEKNQEKQKDLKNGNKLHFWFLYYVIYAELIDY
jgi:hypothetical protein